MSISEELLVFFSLVIVLLPRSAEPPWYAIRMPGGVGGAVSDGRSYPDRALILFKDQVTQFSTLVICWLTRFRAQLRALVSYCETREICD